jgi:hypothetical protein
MNNFEKLLQGKDLRSLGENHKIISLVDNQKAFDELFKYLYSDNRNIKMKAIDAIEKITSKENKYLHDHKGEILNFTFNVQGIEFKWHIAQILGRLKYTQNEMKMVLKKITEWTLTTNESKMVRVNALQSLYDLSKTDEKSRKKFSEVMQCVKKENVPSINARIKKIMSNKE